MDILFWTQCNPKIAIEHTTKKYFGKYLYKIVVYAPAGRLIDDKGPLLAALEHRRNISKNINHAGWWGYRYNKDLEHANIEILEILRNLRRSPVGLKLRVEEPRVQIYAETESDLMQLATQQLSNFKLSIETFAGPADQAAEEALNAGAILRKAHTGYTHKIILRDGRYAPEIKMAILNYLWSMGPETVNISKGLVDTLQNKSIYVWNGYFYTNDPSVSTFINLIHPGLVLNIHELVVLPHK